MPGPTGERDQQGFAAKQPTDGVEKAAVPFAPGWAAVSRSYSSFTEAADENGVFRILIGFDFRKAVREGSSTASGLDGSPRIAPCAPCAGAGAPAPWNSGRARQNGARPGIPRREMPIRRGRLSDSASERQSTHDRRRCGGRRRRSQAPRGGAQALPARPRRVRTRLRRRRHIRRAAGRRRLSVRTRRRRGHRRARRGRHSERASWPNR